MVHQRGQRDRAQRGRGQRQRTKTFQHERTVHVNNLPHDISKAELADALAVFGEIRECLIHKVNELRVSSKRPFTYGFVNFVDEEASSRCLESQMPIDIRGYVLKFNGRGEPGSAVGARTQQQLQQRLPVQLRVPLRRETTLASCSPDQSGCSSLNPEVEFELHQIPTLPSDFNECEFLDGDCHEGLNLLVDCIPRAWSSQKLYDLLCSSTPGIVSVLIYMDEDEYGMRQGLVQMTSHAAAQQCVARGYMPAGQHALGCRRSEVSSIGLLRRCYYGKLSIYHPLYDKRSSPPGSRPGSNPDPYRKDQGISGLPTYDEKSTPQLVDMFASFSPDVDTCTPESAGFTPGTEFTPGIEDDVPTKKYLGTYNNFDSFVPMPTLHQMAGTVVRSPVLHRNQPAVMLPAPLGLVASSTLIIGNVSVQEKENLFDDLRKNVNARALSVDVAKSNEGLRSSYKAFVCYNDPHEALLSFVNLQRYYSGSSVQVRFA